MLRSHETADPGGKNADVQFCSIVRQSERGATHVTLCDSDSDCHIIVTKL